MANPKKAIAALMPPAIDCGEGASVLPMTLAMWAALERIESPLITGKPAKDTMDLLPSLYLLTHGAAEIISGNLLAKAYEWADTVSPLVMERIRRACAAQITVVTDVIPEGGKKKTSDGWIAALVDYFAATYHWSFEEIFWQTPLSALALLRRQEALKKNSIFTLEEIEAIDGQKTQSTT